MNGSVSLRAVLGEVDRARAFLRDAVAGLAFSEEDLFRIELAVTEICINIVRYAYPEDPGDMVIRIWNDGSAVYVECSDGGRPFDPRLVPAPSLETMMSGERKGGLGIYLARRLTDSFEYRRENGRNVVTISKQLPS